MSVALEMAFSAEPGRKRPLMIYAGGCVAMNCSGKAPQLRNLNISAGTVHCRTCIYHRKRSIILLQQTVLLGLHISVMQYAGFSS